MTISFSKLETNSAEIKDEKENYSLPWAWKITIVSLSVYPHFYFINTNITFLEMCLKLI